MAEVAPLMKVFGYKPEIHRGEYDQFKSQVSNVYNIFALFLNNERTFNYKPMIRRKSQNATSANRDYSVDLKRFISDEL